MNKITLFLIALFLFSCMSDESPGIGDTTFGTFNADIDGVSFGSNLVSATANYSFRLTHLNPLLLQLINLVNAFK